MSCNASEKNTSNNDQHIQYSKLFSYFLFFYFYVHIQYWSVSASVSHTHFTISFNLPRSIGQLHGVKYCYHFNITVQYSVYCIEPPLQVKKYEFPWPTVDSKGHHDRKIVANIWLFSNNFEVFYTNISLLGTNLYPKMTLVYLYQRCNHFINNLIVEIAEIASIFMQVEIHKILGKCYE